MTPPILGLHHVTATVTDAQEDLDFYIELLGMRLVKKTVNFDNHHVFHFYYGNERGQPGTIMTTFPYAGKGVRVGTIGAGQITTTSFSVLASALDFWQARFDQRRISYASETTPFGERALRITDPSGLQLRIVGSTSDSRVPWTRADISAEHAIRGIHGVALTVRDASISLPLLTEMMSGSIVGVQGNTTRVTIGEHAPGNIVELVRDVNAPNAVNGLGTVHHAAFAIRDGAQQLEIHDELVKHGFHVTEVRDRQYFTSIYFREPSGVLYEIATLPPGFAVDEELSELGRALKLPPWEEQNRAEIEAGLPSVKY
ncbi:MAG: VOC family protein [Gemmatimonadaceae bacterium]